MLDAHLRELTPLRFTHVRKARRWKNQHGPIRSRVASNPPGQPPPGLQENTACGRLPAGKSVEGRTAGGVTRPQTKTSAGAKLGDGRFGKQLEALMPRPVYSSHLRYRFLSVVMLSDSSSRQAIRLYGPHSPNSEQVPSMYRSYAENSLSSNELDIYSGPMLSMRCLRDHRIVFINT